MEKSKRIKKANNRAPEEAIASSNIKLKFLCFIVSKFINYYRIKWFICCHLFTATLSKKILQSKKNSFPNLFIKKVQILNYLIFIINIDSEISEDSSDILFTNLLLSRALPNIINS